MNIRIIFKQPHWLYLMSLAVLLIWGSIAIYSATQSLYQDTNFFQQHLIYLFIGILLFITVSIVSSDLVKTGAWMLYAFCIILLLVLFIQNQIRPSETPLRWIFIGRLSIQPSELMKIGLILVLARLFSESSSSSFGLFLQSLLITLLPVGLIAIQPDLGTAISLFLIFLIMTFFSRINILYLITLFVGSLGMIWVFRKQFFQTYQWNRIVSFLNPEKDPTGESWSVRQALIAIGSGGVKGKGYLQGTQSKMGFLPDTKYSDFIFAVVGEEFGFFGCFFIISFFGLLLGSSLSIALQTKDLFQKFFVVGIVGLWFLQIVINIGMNIGLLPVTGLPLPFVSYGGSALFTNLLCAGLIYHVHLHKGQIHYIP
ncbi:MAG: FtsW/RodA/SpoVE family cell cycle protein [Caldisericia bacterium]|nr:FtsW/RodA/SpoVE family cell cycle protein [Caldisericia bacterium]MDD4613883.1 FtsW/RodA/SpoVE family cell cycle protein [Caldisericia bacterium]